MQAAILRLRAAGRTRVQISNELEMSRDSVDGHMDRGLAFLRKHGLLCTPVDLDKVSDKYEAPRARIRHATSFRNADDVREEIRDGLRCHCWLLKPCHDHEHGRPA